MKILHLEDNPDDAMLIAAALKSEWPELAIAVVDDRASFVTALERGDFDLVLSDFRLPGVDAREALALVLQRRPDIPVIFVSGTIGEDVAAEIVRSGAADYVLKDRLDRLPVAINNALQQCDERRKRREAEHRLREQAELLNKVQDGIVVFSLGNRVLYWNAGAEKIFGWVSDEAVGRTVAELFGRNVDSTFKALEQQLLGSNEWRSEISLGNKFNRPLLCEVRVTVVKDAAGQSTSRLAIVTDVTERKHLEAQLQRAHRLESLGMLAAGIAHDLNNALAPMLMAGGLLRTRVSDPADLRLVELLEQSAQRGAALVKQIVSFAGSRSRERLLIQPKHLLHDIVQLVRDTFPKSIRVETEFPDDLWTVHGNPTQLHQVLLNLCINARDAMAEGGTLHLAARNEVLTAADARMFTDGAPGRYVVLEVADTGSGIPVEVLHQMWEPFFTTKAEGEGTGLGLSTVRGIVSDHRGFLHVQSQVGSGSTFQVFLPASADVVTPSGRSRAPFTLGNGRGELVLVVDDQESVRESIAVVLSKNGYSPLTTSDGVEALSKYADRIRHLSVVITDLDMPGLNGSSFAQAILRLNPVLKVLFISGTGEGRTARLPGITTGAAFLEKPFTPEALLARVDGLLHPVAR